MQERVRCLRLAMDEFGAELDRDAEARQVARPAAPADAIARFEDDDRATRARKRIGRGEAGGACADYEDVRSFRITRP